MSLKLCVKRTMQRGLLTLPLASKKSDPTIPGHVKLSLQEMSVITLDVMHSSDCAFGRDKWLGLTFISPENVVSPVTGG